MNNNPERKKSVFLFIIICFFVGVPHQGCSGVSIKRKAWCNYLCLFSTLRPWNTLTQEQTTNAHARYEDLLCKAQQGIIIPRRCLLLSCFGCKKKVPSFKVPKQAPINAFIKLCIGKTCKCVALDFDSRPTTQISFRLQRYNSFSNKQNPF